MRCGRGMIIIGYQSYLQHALRHCSHSLPRKSDTCKQIMAQVLWPFFHPLCTECAVLQEWMCVCVCTCAAAPVCECVLSLTVRVMTSNTNPLDWDYSSSRAAARRPEADARDQFSLLTRHFGRTPAVFRLCDFVSQALTRDIKVTHIL